MIFNTNQIFAKVWKVKRPENGKYIDLQITTSEKDGDGEYKNSGWFPRCIGHSVNSLKNIKDGDRIVITKSKFTNERYEAEDGTTKSRFRFLILEANIANDTDGTDKPAETQKETSAPESSDDKCPW